MASFSEIQNFNKLFDEYNERFIRFAFGYVKERAAAEDFVSEAIIPSWKTGVRLSSITPPPVNILTTFKTNAFISCKPRQFVRKLKKDWKILPVWLFQRKSARWRRVILIF